MLRKFTDNMDIRFLRPDDPLVQSIEDYHPKKVYGELLASLAWEVHYTGQAAPVGLESSNYEWVIIPRGFISDGVTVRRYLWWFLPSWGHPIVRAAILHDWLIHCFRSVAGPHSAYPTRKRIDAVFYEAARSVGCSLFVSSIAWAFIRTVSKLKGEG